MILSGFSVCMFFVTITSGESIVRTIIFWNVSIAWVLAEKGVLPICENCELMSVIHVLYWGFLIGSVGFSIGVFLILKPRIGKERFAK